MTGDKKDKKRNEIFRPGHAEPKSYFTNKPTD